MAIRSLLVHAVGAACMCLAAWGCGDTSGADCPGSGRCEWGLTGGSDASFAGSELSAGREIAVIEFPPGSAQSEGTWYRLNVDLELRFRPVLTEQAVSAAFPAFLSLAVGGGTAFQLKLSASERAPGGCTGFAGANVEWSTYGLVHGTQAGTVPCDGTVRLGFSNFLQTRSVRSGPTPVTLKLESESPAVLDSVTVGGESHIMVTDEGPQRVEIIPQASSLQHTPRGAEVLIQLGLRLNGRPAEGASVFLQHIRSDGAIVSTTEAVGDGALYTARMPWEEPGPAVFLVSASLEGASTLRYIRVGPKRRDPRTFAVGVAGAVGGTLLVAGLLAAPACGMILRRRGSRRP